MELSSTIAQPLTSNATSLKPELDDKSFDLGDDTGLDVQAALGPFYKPSHSLHAEPVASTSQVTLDDVQSDDGEQAQEDAAMEARIAELEADAFSDDIAEDMIADLKEIGMFRSPVHAASSSLWSRRHVQVHSEICHTTRRTAAEIVARFWNRGGESCD